MEHDLDTFCQDLEERLGRLTRETIRLSEENARLLKENRALREELTVARLDREWDSAPQADPMGVTMRQLVGIPAEALAFYHRLPDVMQFADFFAHAEEEGMDNDEARTLLRLFLRERLLEQRGRRIQKRSNIQPLRAAARR